MSVWESTEMLYYNCPSEWQCILECEYANKEELYGNVDGVSNGNVDGVSNGNVDGQSE